MSERVFFDLAGVKQHLATFRFVLGNKKESKKLIVGISPLSAFILSKNNKNIICQVMLRSLVNFFN
jgi:hypothetical protein